MQKQIFLVAAAVFALALMLAPLTHDVDAQASKKKPKQCNNVKIHVNVKGVEENQTVIGVVTLGQNTNSKMGTVEENETSINLPFNFKKITCPSIPSPFTGFVNGTEFSGELKSTKKPNKVSVTLP